jgi:16S rRNA (cytosine1402-N4)-methyltransferase
MVSGAAGFHVPALVQEVVAAFEAPFDDQEEPLIIDCTVGGGGHLSALLRRFDRLRALGIDRDERALGAAAERIGDLSERVVFVKGDFGDLQEIARDTGVDKVRGILYDLGVSSAQLDEAQRGFGYRRDAPLDMRMDRSSPLSAEDVVNNYSENELSSIIGRYGEERFARRVARAIVRRREREPIRGTQELAEIVKEAIPAAARRRGPHPARRTFMALRIEVNRELESLERSLPQAIDLLEPQGQVAVIAYHSLEDRIVKRTFAEASRGCLCPRDVPVCVCGRRAILQTVGRRPIRPSEDEVSDNPRARSARMRIARRLGGEEAA